MYVICDPQTVAYGYNGKRHKGNDEKTGCIDAHNGLMQDQGKFRLTKHPEDRAAMIQDS